MHQQRPTDRRPLQRGHWVAKLTLAALSFILALAALELCIRTVFPVYDPSGSLEFVANEQGVPLGPAGFSGRMWRNTGDYDVPVNINSVGFRDTRDVKNSTANDIFVVGDSFSFGLGVTENRRYSNRLQDLVNIPVYNIAIPTDIDGYRRLVEYARSKGATVQRLVVGVCMENDLSDYAAKAAGQRSVASSGHAPRVRFQGIKALLRTRSAVYSMLTSLVHQNGPLRTLATSIGVLTDNIAGIGTNTYDPTALASSIDELKRVTAGTRAIVLVIPSRAIWVGTHTEVEKRVHEEFVSLARRDGLTVLDLRPVFEAGGDPMQYHFTNDGHWNERGHARAAEALAVLMHAH